MSKYTVYSKNDCPFCRRAVILLLQEELEYEEIKLDEADDYEKAVGELVARLGGVRPKTVPQIFLGDKHIGGFTELAHSLGVDPDSIKLDMREK